MNTRARAVDIRDHHQNARVFDILLVVIVLLGVSLLLRVRTFGTLHRLVKAWPVIQPSAAVNREYVISRMNAVLGTVGGLCLGRNRCLYRAATAVCVLRTKGIAAQLVIGVRALPFASHAWVEIDRCVVLEPTAWNTIYKEIERI